MPCILQDFFVRLKIVFVCLFIGITVRRHLVDKSRGAAVWSLPCVLLPVPLGFVPSSYSDRGEMLSAEEIGIIIIVLGVWMMAIVLFFNRCDVLSHMAAGVSTGCIEM